MESSTLTTVQAGRRPVHLTARQAEGLRCLRELRGRPRKPAPAPEPEPEPEAGHATRTLGQQLRAAPPAGRPGSLRAQLQARRQRVRVRTAQAAAVLDAAPPEGSEPAGVPTTSMLTQFRRRGGGQK